MIITLDRELLMDEVGKLSKRQLDLIFAGIDRVLSRWFFKSKRWEFT